MKMYFNLFSFFSYFIFKKLSFSVWQTTASVMPKDIVIIVS